MADGSLYVVKDDQELTAEWLNQLLGDIHTRIRTIEGIKAQLQTAIAELTALGLRRIDEAVAPLITKAQEDVAAIEQRLEEVAGQIEALLAGGVPAANVTESLTKVFVTPEQRTAIGQIAALVAGLPTKAPSANAILSGLLTIAGAAKLTGVVAPPALAADANDLTPPDFATASRVKISTTAARSITGLAAAEDGRVVMLENVTGYDITLKAESTASAAANRFAFHVDAVLSKNGGLVTLIYDAGLARWLLAGGGKISDLQVGDILETTANPGVRFLPTNGSLYLNASYPALRAVLGPYQNPMVSRLASPGNTPRLSYLNGLYVAFVNNGAWELRSSPDLVNWTLRTMPTAGAVGSGLSYGAGLYVWNDGTTIKTSPDLVIWTTRALPSGFSNVGTIARGATKFVGSATKTGGVPGAIYSTDGITWTGSASAFTGILNAVAYNATGGRWIITATGGRIFRSLDNGITWTDLGVLLAGTAYLAYSAAGSFVVGLQSAPFAYISADGQTWTAPSAAYTAGTGGAQTAVITHDGAAFIIGHLSSNVLARSADLVNWTFQAVPGVTDIQYLVRLGGTVNDPYVISTATSVSSGLDLSTTQFQTPTIAGRASNSSVYIKAL